MCVMGPPKTRCNYMCSHQAKHSVLPASKTRVSVMFSSNLSPQTLGMALFLNHDRYST
jgi:hypothetical protein